MPVNGSGRFIGPGQPIRDGLVGWYDTRYKRDSLSDGGDWTDLSGNNRNFKIKSLVVKHLQNMKVLNQVQLLV